MGNCIIKVNRGPEDLYVRWTSVLESPTHMGTRAELTEAIVALHPTVSVTALGLDQWFGRADELGSSAGIAFARWESLGWTVGHPHRERRWLPRARLAEYTRAVLDGDARAGFAAFALTFPPRWEPDRAPAADGPDMAAFLEARLAEFTGVERNHGTEGCDLCGHTPAVPLAMVAAQRAVITRYLRQLNLLSDGLGGLLTQHLAVDLETTLREFAVAFHTHPGYRYEWRP
ncbi:DUF6221 family protein [Streptosporangium sp. NPDC002524]|uniref:DUF6221 family protein n=1 Tax=Streptosporangium sp. NPDC002524 TaxID=3154537 RepID=UPI003325DC68